MRSLAMKALGLVAFLFSGIPLAMGATITGSVKGPDGKPFKGAFVEAQNTKTNIMTDVLSHEDGRYTVPDLPAGTYQVTIRAVGYKAAPQSEALQTADQHAKCNFALEKGIVTWSDLSVWQGQVLLPPGKGKSLFFGGGPTNETPFGMEGPCFACHNFQSRMATRRLNFRGWLGLVNFMRVDVAPQFLAEHPRFTNQMADEAASYLTQVFGMDSTLPTSPAELPGYQATVRKFTSEAMNIVYVVYPTPDSNWLPFQMYPPTSANDLPSDGSIWVTEFGNANEVDQINPTNNKSKEYHTVTCPGPANIHAIEVGPAGDAWFAESSCYRVGSVNPRTGKVTEYEYPEIKGRRGNPHDSHPILYDGKLYVFSSGTASQLDPTTGKFTLLPEVHVPYDVIQDKNGNIWYTEGMFSKLGSLDEVNPETLKVKKYIPPIDPETFYPHRLAIAPNGDFWCTCQKGKVCRFDLKTKSFKDYNPLGPDTDDYAIAVDPRGGVWYSLSSLDTVQRLDPKTGHIVEYPFPYPEITMRKFFVDAQGRIWWASNGNGVVGYFYLMRDHLRAAK